MGSTEKPVFHKNLKDLPQVPPDTVIYDDFAYKLMFNTLGSFLVFAKLENLSAKVRTCFLKTSVIPGWHAG